MPKHAGYPYDNTYTLRNAVDKQGLAQLDSAQRLAILP